jgi:hypothetical protein
MLSHHCEFESLSGTLDSFMSGSYVSSLRAVGGGRQCLKYMKEQDDNERSKASINN